jgi:hypothetical protein
MHRLNTVNGTIAASSDIIINKVAQASEDNKECIKTKETMLVLRLSEGCHQGLRVAIDGFGEHKCVPS